MEGALSDTAHTTVPVDRRTPCIIGVGSHTWHPTDAGDNGGGAPEPLTMWEDVARAAAHDSGARADLLGRVDSLDVVYCQTWQYDDPAGRLAARLSATPSRTHYSGIGGTTPHQLLADAAQRILDGTNDMALITGAEALATTRALKKAGDRPSYSFPPDGKRPFPWEAPFHPAEVAHGVFQAWLTFATFDNARRAHLGAGLADYRDEAGRMLAPMTEVAAANPEAWFRSKRTADEIVTATPDNRMVGYPYTKYMMAVMDVDMAAALLVTSHETADSLGVPADRRVYPRGWCYATDPVLVAEHPELWRSPALEAVGHAALGAAGVGIDDIGHLDLYSCFPGSLNFARDALGLASDDSRPLTVTGGLPYHGGPGSNYMTHSLTAMTRSLRDDAGSYGLVSGVGMHMTKHAVGVYSTTPGTVIPVGDPAVQTRLDAAARPTVLEHHQGPATVAAYSVVHGRDGEPEWGILVCDVDDATRCYARLEDADDLAWAERTELVGTMVQLTPTDRDGPAGSQRVNLAQPA